MTDRYIKKFMSDNFTRKDLMGYQLLEEILRILVHYYVKNGRIDTNVLTLEYMSDKLDIKYDVLHRNLTTFARNERDITVKSPKKMMYIYFYRLIDRK